jgi:hypothetical protein
MIVFFQRCNLQVIRVVQVCIPVAPAQMLCWNLLLGLNKATLSNPTQLEAPVSRIKLPITIDFAFIKGAVSW